MSDKELVSVEVKPAQLLQIAVDSGADLDKLEKLMDLQMRYEENEARKAYNEAISAFRSECPAIKKTRKAHNSKYAGLAETIEQIKGLMSKHGLSHSWRTLQGENKSVGVTCVLTHRQGHKEETTLYADADTSGSKNSIQAIGSTVTYLQRYTLFAMLGLAGTDQDLDGELPESDVDYINRDQLARIDELIIATNTDENAFCTYYKIKSVPLLPVSKYEHAVSGLEAKLKKKDSK